MNETDQVFFEKICVLNKFTSCHVVCSSISLYKKETDKITIQLQGAKSQHLFQVLNNHKRVRHT